MLTITDITKTFGADTILKKVSFVVNPGECVGLVGPNGCGKSTLLRIIKGEIIPDSGTVSLNANTILGYLPQGFELNSSSTISEVVLSGIPDLVSTQKAVEKLALEMEQVEGTDLEQTVQAYGEALTRLERLGGYSIYHQVEKVLQGLGLGNIPLDHYFSELSGGQKTRVGLARLLISNPDILLLDEPTNHLDIQALEWLETFLQKYTGSVIIVSHDRMFLDNTITKVIALNIDTHEAKEYPGNYSDYITTHLREIEQQWNTWNDQQTEIQRMEADIHRTKHHAISVEKTTTSRQPGVRRIAKKVARKAKSREKKLQRYLDSEERVEKPQKGWQINLEFGEMPHSGQMVMTLKDISFGYEKGQLLFNNLKANIKHGEKIALLGPNGSGKSTLLKIIVGKQNPEGGLVHLGSNVKIGYMPQDQETLPASETALSLIQHSSSLNETDARNFLHYFLFAGDEVLVLVSQLSYGERARLLLAKLIIEGANFLVLDEPINHLDIPSREHFEAALNVFPGAILAAVHDRAFIKSFSNKHWHLRDKKLEIIYP